MTLLRFLSGRPKGGVGIAIDAYWPFNSAVRAAAKKNVKAPPEKYFCPWEVFPIIAQLFPDEVVFMTNDCPTEQQLSAFHDGELPDGARAVIAGHLEWCEPCNRQLASIRRMSGLFASAASDRLSQISWHRLHAKLDSVMERGLVRWAWEVSGIAAAILIISSVCLTQLSDPAGATAAVPPWVGAQASADPVLSETPTPAAVWYLADAKTGTETAP